MPAAVIVEIGRKLGCLQRIPISYRQEVVPPGVQLLKDADDSQMSSRRWRQLVSNLRNN